MLLDDRIAADDGLEMARLIAAASQCGASIIATIHCDNLAAEFRGCRSLKLETYLVKPIDMSELAKVIRDAMAGEAGEVLQDHAPRAMDTAGANRRAPAAKFFSPTIRPTTGP